MFLIHYYEAKVPVWQEQGRAGSKHDVWPLTMPYGCCYVALLCCTLGRVKDKQLSAKMHGQPVFKLPAKGNFRDQIQHILPFGKDIKCQADVDFRFAGARYTM